MEVISRHFPGGTEEKPVRTAGVPAEIRTGTPPEYKSQELPLQPICSLSHLILFNVIILVILGEVHK
jgi:hypothetical protein